MNNRSWKSQRGLTLVELMIAVTLSGVIAAAMISLFVNSKQNYRINENMSRLQESARFAVSFLSRDIRMADYRDCVSSARTTPLLTAISGENDTGLNSSDSVTLQWQTDNCGVTQTRAYSIQAGSTGNPALFRSTNGAAAEELVEGIQSLQILYGQDTDGDDVANYYVSSSSITNMTQVISAKITLVAQTLETNLTTSGERVTRSFTSTVTLRNRIR